jgi:hypothetical protein
MSSHAVVGHPDADHNVMSLAPSGQPALQDECTLEAGSWLAVEHGCDTSVARSRGS